MVVENIYTFEFIFNIQIRKKKPSLLAKKYL